MKKWIHIIGERCTGCRICQLVCSFRNFGTISLENSRIKVLYYPPGIDVPTFCRHCEDPRCLPACPEGAITQEKDKVVIDPGKCTGCGKCEEACPYDGVFVDKTSGKAILCLLCGQCVKDCPNNCLVMAEGRRDEMSFEQRAEAVMRKLESNEYYLGKND